MKAVFGKRFVLAPLVALAIFVHSPFLSGQKVRPEARLSVGQRAEITFVNGLRNAQRRNDVYGQTRHLQKTLVEIEELRASAGDLKPADDKLIAKRVKQLQRMIRRESPIEVL